MIYRGLNSRVIKMTSVFTRPKLHANKATQRYTFDVQGIDLSIVNGLRRTILTDIPSVGIVFEGEPSMSIETNTGPLHNEILTHRMSMIPIYLSEEELENYEDNSLTFELNKSNRTDYMVNVTTHDMRLMKDNKELTGDQIKQYFPVNEWSKEPILITRLRPKERVHMYGSFVKSTARENAGFAPVSLCTFSPHLNKDKIQSENIQGVLQRERTFLQNDFGDPIAWTFEIEPETGLDAGYLVSKAFSILKNKIQKSIQTLSTEALEFEKNEIASTYEYIFRDEDDTLGNMIQSYMHNTYYRTQTPIQQQYLLQYVGYYCPHPLDPKVNVRLTVVPTSDENKNLDVPEVVVRDILKMGLQELLIHMEELHTEWNRINQRTEKALEADAEAEAKVNNEEGSEQKEEPPAPIPEPAPKVKKPRQKKEKVANPNP
jgi:DNA-directed RNA polymerase subunit L